MVRRHGSALPGLERQRRDFAVPNTLGTTFNIGSITKTFTALAILQLVEQGRVKTDDPLSAYLPDCPVPERDVITVDQLLTHTSGLYDYANDENAVFDTLFKRTTGELLPFVYGKGLLFPPGTDVSYSSGGFLLLGAIIEKVSGMPYARYVDERILKPAGMTETALFMAEDASPNKAVGYKRLDGERYANRSLMYFPGSPAGGLYATAGDLLKYVRALAGGRLLAPKYVSLLFEPRTKEVAARGCTSSPASTAPRSCSATRGAARRGSPSGSMTRWPAGRARVAGA